MSKQAPRSIVHPGFTGLIGAARRDITPPVGIHNRMWAAATDSVAAGIHRPLTATAVSIQGDDADRPLVLVSLDLGWWRNATDERDLRLPILKHFGLDESHLMIHLTHTHAGPATSVPANDQSGVQYIAAYMHQLRDRVIDAIQEAINSARSGHLEWATGRCDLATNRLLPDPSSSKTLVGFNPDQPADDTLLLGRVVNDARDVICTLVNYACHPTTLGPDNRLISPDYVGAMREVVEQATGNKPCLFMQGASGDLGPRYGFVGDPSVADRNGRQLGYASLATLEGMMPPRHTLDYARTLVSGAELAVWEPNPHRLSTAMSARCIHIDLPTRKLSPASELAKEMDACDDPVMLERLERAYRLRVAVEEAGDQAMQAWLWQVGEAFVIGLPAEAHSHLQQELRRRFPDRAILVMNITNGYESYLPRLDEYATGSYQVDVALYEAGCLEHVIEACSQVIASWAPTEPTGPAPIPPRGADPAPTNTADAQRTQTKPKNPKESV